MFTKKIKIFALFLIAVFTLVLCSSCNDKPEEQSETTESEASETTTGEIPTDGTDPMLIVGNVSACKGDEVTVPVQIVNNPGVAGALIELIFDDRLTLKNAEVGEAFSVLDYTKPGKYENPCRFNWDSESGMTTENGNVLLLTFKVSEDVQTGEKLSVECSYKIGDIYDEELNDVTLQIQNGNIQITEGE